MMVCAPLAQPAPAELADRLAPQAQGPAVTQVVVWSRGEAVCHLTYSGGSLGLREKQ